MWSVLLTTAFGADTYINGTVVDPRAVADVRLERATVWFDALGNVHIDAPGYTVEVLEPALADPVEHAEKHLSRRTRHDGLLLS